MASRTLLACLLVLAVLACACTSDRDPSGFGPRSIPPEWLDTVSDTEGRFQAHKQPKAERWLSPPGGEPYGGEKVLPPAPGCTLSTISTFQAVALDPVVRHYRGLGFSQDDLRSLSAFGPDGSELVWQAGRLIEGEYQHVVVAQLADGAAAQPDQAAVLVTIARERCDAAKRSAPSGLPPAPVP